MPTTAGNGLRSDTGTRSMGVTANNGGCVVGFGAIRVCRGVGGFVGGWGVLTFLVVLYCCGLTVIVRKDSRSRAEGSS